MKSETPKLTVQITRIIDEDFPGFVECFFSDVEGRLHHFVEKLPVVSDSKESQSLSDLPKTGEIECSIEEKFTGDNGIEMAKIDTGQPWSIESTTGETKFVVAISQLKSP